MVTVFSPSVHVALPPLVTGVSPFLISTVAPSLAGVTVILLVASVVVAVYANTSGLNVGVSVSAPIASVDRDAFKGLQYQAQRLPT